MVAELDTFVNALIYTALNCRVHAGMAGLRCQKEGCGSAAADKLSRLCKAHGGGHRCQFPGGCNSTARGGFPLCVPHGGGRPCLRPGCTKLAITVKRGRCREHDDDAGII